MDNKVWIDAIIKLAFTLLGFGLACGTFIFQEKVRQAKGHCELMRSLLMEISSNRLRCEGVANGALIPMPLETISWDRIRYSDCLYDCIISHDNSIYRQLLRVYSEITTVNFCVARYFSAVDGNTRFPMQDNMNAVNTTLANAKQVASIILPTINTLGDSLNSFLYREKYFKK